MRIWSRRFGSLRRGYGEAQSQYLHSKTLQKFAHSLVLALQTIVSKCGAQNLTWGSSFWAKLNVSHRVDSKSYSKVRSPRRLLLGIISSISLLAGLLVGMPPATASTPVVTSTTITSVAQGSSTVLAGISVGGYLSTDSIFVEVSTSNGILSIPNTTGLVLSYGFTQFSGPFFSFVGDEANVNAALSSLTLQNPYQGSANVSVLTTLNQPGIAYLPTNGHFYQFVAASNITWLQANQAALGTNFEGQPGYLASAPTATENQFISTMVPNVTNAWLGGHAINYPGGGYGGGGAVQRVWEWTGGPLNGMPFTQCDNLGSASTAAPCVHDSDFMDYYSWAANYPGDFNDTTPAATESLYSGGPVVVTGNGANALIDNYSGTTGLWYDLNDGSTPAMASGYTTNGYVVEFGGQTNTVNSGTGFTGTYSSSSTLTVTAPVAPAPPAAATATPSSNGAATIAWVDPQNVAGESYLVSSSPGGGSCTTTLMSCVVSGLTPGVSYTFSVVGSVSGIASTPTVTSPIVEVFSPTITVSVAAGSSTGTAVLSAQVIGGQLPSGQVAFSQNGAQIATVNVSQTGVATDNLTGLTPGSSYSFMAMYSGDSANLPAMSQTVQLAIPKIVPSLNIEVAPIPLAVGKGATISVTSNPAISGDISIFDNNNLIGTATFDSAGVASLFGVSLPLGQNSVSATFAGNSTTAATTATLSNPVGVTLQNSMLQTTVTLPSTGQQIGTIGVVLFNSSLGNPIVGATLDVTDATTGANLGSITTDTNGRASIDLDFIAISGTRIEVTYSGSSTVSPIVSAPIQIPNLVGTPPLRSVQGKSSLILSVGSAPNVPTYTFSSVELVARLAPPTASGIVAFSLGDSSCSASVVGGEATCYVKTTNAESALATANYSGDSNLLPTNSSLLLSVVPSPVSVAVSVAPTHQVYGQVIEYQADFSSTAPSPTQQIQGGIAKFQEGSTLLCESPVVDGVANCTTDQTPAGPSSVVVTRSSDPNYLYSSGFVNVDVVPTTNSLVTSSKQIQVSVKPRVRRVISTEKPLGIASIAVSGLQGGSSIEVFVASNPVLMDSRTVPSSGALTYNVPLPVDLPGGSHHLLLAAIEPGGQPVTYGVSFTVGNTGLISAIASNGHSSVTTLPNVTHSSTPTTLPLATYSVANHPKEAVKVTISLFVISAAAIGGLTLPVRGGTSGDGGGFAPSGDPSSDDDGGTDMVDVEPSSDPEVRFKSSFGRRRDYSDVDEGVSLVSAEATRSSNLVAEGGNVTVGAVLASGAVAASVGVASAANSSVSTDHKSTSRKSSKITSAKAKHYKGTAEGDRFGDRSFTYRAPGMEVVDRVGKEIPIKVAKFSPVLSRILVDGAYLRAIFGSLYVLLPVAAGVVAVIAALGTLRGAMLPPSFSLMITLTILGLFDAFSGLVAAVIYGVVGLATVSFTSANDIRTFIGLMVIWLAIPLIAAATRPFRRLPNISMVDVYDRLGDFAIAPLIGGLAAQKMVGALTGLSGLQLPIAKSANLIAIVVISLIVVRMAIETTVAHGYRNRLGKVSPDKVPDTSKRQKVVSLSFKSILLIFAAIVYIGNTWQLYVGAAMSFLPSLASLYQEKFPNVPKLCRAIPAKLLKIVVMTFVGSLWAGLVFSYLHHDHNLVADSFVVLSIPGFVESILELFGREGDSWKLTWPIRFGGVIIFALGVALTVGWLAIP